VNGGTMYKPRLVAQVDNPRTGERRVVDPETTARVRFRQEHVDFVKRAMAGVMKEGTGARSFASAQYTSGGKTGTAQVIGMKQGEKYDESKVAERFRDHSLFIAFAPLDSPKIALAVIVENGGFGARAAAPISRTVLDYFLLGKVPAGMQMPTPEDEAAEAEESD
jgi:penicillin-binding protein 2